MLTLMPKHFEVGAIANDRRSCRRIAHERVMFAPIWELAFLNGVGARVEEAGLGLTIIEGRVGNQPQDRLNAWPHHRTHGGQEAQHAAIG